jgi:hypothetical protein
LEKKVKDWPIEKICKERSNITFPVYQREKRLWNPTDKRNLIDSILKGIDIPKLYFYKVPKTKTYEVVDGQQRLWAIWDFYDGLYKLSNGRTFGKLKSTERALFINYILQITEITEADENDLRLLFLRLQLGLLLNTGEKLHALTGVVKDFVFKKMCRHHFIRETVNIPRRRFSKQTLCAQICINSYHKAKSDTFFRTRFKDLEDFFIAGKSPKSKELNFLKKRFDSIRSTLSILDKYFANRGHLLKNRSFVLSIYLFVEELTKNKNPREIKETVTKFVKFTELFLKRLREEIKAGFKRKNEDLYNFQSYLNNAPGERYQIAHRHEELKKFFTYYLAKGKIKGDR